MGYKLTCDMCSKDIDEDVDLVGKKNFTTKSDDGNAIVLKIEVEVDELTGGSLRQSEKPAMCLDCLEKAIVESVREAKGYDDRG